MLDYQGALLNQSKRQAGVSVVGLEDAGSEDREGYTGAGVWAASRH